MTTTREPSPERLDFLRRGIASFVERARLAIEDESATPAELQELMREGLATIDLIDAEFGVRT